MTLVAFMTAPFVNSIKIQLPGYARRTKDGPMQFVKRMPPDTRLELTLVRLMPWPKRRTIMVSELRRLPGSWKRLANFEHVPKRNEGKEIKWWQRIFLNTFYGHLYIKPGLHGQRRSRAPGIWDMVLNKVDEWSAKRAGEVAGQRLPSPSAAVPRAPALKGLNRVQRGPVDKAQRPVPPTR